MAHASMLAEDAVFLTWLPTMPPGSTAVLMASFKGKCRVTYSNIDGYMYGDKIM